MILIFLIGALCGFCSSAPLGPINLWIANSALEDADHRVYKPFLFGVIIVDVIFAWIAILGYQAFFEHQKTARYIGLGGAIFLIFLGMIGIKAIMKPIAMPESPPTIISPSEKTVPWIKNFSLGAVLCGSNPAFIMFWVFAVSSLSQYSEGLITIPHTLFFLLGIIIGDGLWFGTLITVIKRFKEKIGKDLLKNIRLCIAFIYIIIGIYFLNKYGLQHNNV